MNWKVSDRNPSNWFPIGFQEVSNGGKRLPLVYIKFPVQAPVILGLGMQPQLKAPSGILVENGQVQ